MANFNSTDIFFMHLVGVIGKCIFWIFLPLIVASILAIHGYQEIKGYLREPSTDL